MSRVLELSGSLRGAAFGAGSKARRGFALGTVGVLAFSVTLPATRAADPVFGSITVGLGRVVIAAALAAVVLTARGERLIVPKLLPRLGIVVLGVVIGFPLLTTLALQDVSSAHAAVVSGLLPAATAGMAVARAGERPRREYWFALVIGLVAVLGFAAIQGAGRPRLADLLVLAAVVLAGLGFADGATLAREYGGWRVICWALVLTLPVLLPITVTSAVLHPPVHVTIGAALGLGYVSVISTFLAFFAWYAGLARGGVARIGRLQLIQPVLTLGWSALLLGEHISLATGIAAVIVLAVVVVGRKARVDQILPDRAVAAEPISQ
ncbi:MAG: DMT family transporter [Pseudonocardiales bacterium]|nr:DMT family transporter [Pseudonocardiales bacterium]MBV9729416.1 DMT family transporter [Pseudonocardiales bacterium]